MANSPIFITTPVSNAQSYLPADVSTVKTIRTYGALGGRTEHLRITSIDTAARVVAFYINTGGSDLFIGSVSVGVGSAATPTNVDVLATLYTNVVKQFILGNAAAVLKAKITSTVTAACEIDIFEDGGDY